MEQNKIKFLQKNINNKTPKEISDRFNFDLQKDIKIISGFAPFTHKKILELAEITSTTNAIIFIYNDLAYFKQWKAARITPEGFELVKFYGTQAGEYWRKADIEADRKCEQTRYIIIAQDQANSKQPKAQSHFYEDTTRRIRKITKINKWCNTCGGASYIGKIEYINEQTGKPACLDVSCYKAQNIAQIIDKSGYFKIELINELQQRNKKRIADRKKAEADATNNEAQIKELAGYIALIKYKYIEALKDAKTYKSWSALDTINRQILWLIYDFERHQEKIQDKKYLSVEAINNNAESITQKAREIQDNILNYLLEDK